MVDRHATPRRRDELDEATGRLLARLCLDGESFGGRSGFAVLPCWRERQDGAPFVTRLDGRRIVADADQAANEANGGAR